MSTKTPMLYDDDNPDGRELPWVWEICSHCEGHGTSSAYLGAFTRRDLDEAGEEFVEDYIDGKLDRACEFCDGGRVKVVDRAKLTKAERKAYDAQQREEAVDRQTERMERLMEGGWREEGWYGND